MNYAEKLELLKQLGELQGEMAEKARKYKSDDLTLSMRFDRASQAAMTANMFMQAALMAEREAEAVAAL